MSFGNVILFFTLHCVQTAVNTSSNSNLYQTTITMLRKRLPTPTQKVEKITPVRFAKPFLKGILVIAASLVGLGSAKAQEWNPPGAIPSTTIDRTGEVLIGTNVPAIGQQLLVGNGTSPTGNRNIGQLESGLFGGLSNIDIWSTLGGTRGLPSFLAGKYGLRMNYGQQSTNLLLERPLNAGIIATPILQWSDNSTTDENLAVPFIINRRIGTSGSTPSRQIMRLNANGNVGIGTQTPDTRFEVESINDQGAASGFSPMSQFIYSRTANVNGFLVGITVDAVNSNLGPIVGTVTKGLIGTSRGSVSNIGISGSGNGIFNEGTLLNIGVEGFADQPIDPNKCNFTQIGVAGTATVNGLLGTSSSVAIYGNAFGNGTSNNGGGDILDNTKWAGVFIGDLGFTGSLLGPSDSKLKKEIKPMSSSILAKVLQLNPSTYFYNNSRESSLLGLTQNQIQGGFIAQELERIFPELVEEKTVPVLTGKKENPVENVTYKGVNYLGLIPYMVAASQEQQKLIETLQNKVTALEKQGSTNSVKTNKDVELAGSLEFVGISPNPTNGLTNIQVQATGVVNGELIMVINLNGKVMAEHQLTKGENSYTLDATNWAAGMYIATYSANGAKPVTRTFIVR